MAALEWRVHDAGNLKFEPPSSKDEKLSRKNTGTALICVLVTPATTAHQCAAHWLATR
jgi:hypothetical protein